MFKKTPSVLQLGFFQARPSRSCAHEEGIMGINVRTISPFLPTVEIANCFVVVVFWQPRQTGNTNIRKSVVWWYFESKESSVLPITQYLYLFIINFERLTFTGLRLRKYLSPFWFVSSLQFIYFSAFQFWYKFCCYFYSSFTRGVNIGRPQ
jgi:hypothetical protein